MKSMFANLGEARPHPDPLPRGEGTAVGRINFYERFARRWPVSICRIQENSRIEPLSPRCQILPGCGNPFLPLPGGEGRGEGGLLHSHVTLGVHEKNMSEVHRSTINNNAFTK